MRKNLSKALRTGACLSALLQRAVQSFTRWALGTGGAGAAPNIQMPSPHSPLADWDCSAAGQVAQAWDPSTGQAEAEASLQVWDPPGLHRKILCDQYPPHPPPKIDPLVYKHGKNKGLENSSAVENALSICGDTGSVPSSAKQTDRQRKELSPI